MIKEYINSADIVFLSTDYDADGISCSVVGCKTLESLGVNYKHILLNNKYPRGVNDKVIDIILSSSKQDERILLITADHGSSDIDRYKRLRKERKNVKIVITDHHLIDDVILLEEVVDMIKNPQYSKCDYPAAYSGCNVLYKTLEPLMREDLKKKLKPIVMMANLIDQMDMSSLENKKLYREMLPYMEHSEVFKTLLRKTYKKQMHDRWILMNVGPLINSTHRLGKPEVAFRFLMGDLSEIDTMMVMNKSRKEQTTLLYQLLSSQVKANKNILKKVMVLLNPTETTSFNGLVAGRIGNELNIPTFVLSRNNAELKGSARAIQKIPLIEILDYIKSKSDCIKHHAGHHAACGISLGNSMEDLQEFVKYFEEYLAINNIMYTDIKDHEIISPTDIDEALIKIEEGRPYGQGNPYPIFESIFTIANINSYKTITKIYLEETPYEMIYFKPLNFSIGDKINVSFTIEVDSKISLTANEIRQVKD